MHFRNILILMRQSYSFFFVQKSLLEGAHTLFVSQEDGLSADKHEIEENGLYKTRE